MSHYDIILAKKLSGNSVDLEALSVTSNGQYTAAEGKAYWRIYVSVPQPSKFYAAIYKDDTLTDVYINTDSTTPNYYASLNALINLRNLDPIFGELHIYETAHSGNIYTYELRQGETVIGTITKNTLKPQETSVVWTTSHIVLTTPYTATTDGGVPSGYQIYVGAFMRLFSKAPLYYGQT